MPKHLPVLPLATRRALLTLGADISAARRRRRLPLEVIAERAQTSRQTVARVERGDPRVSMGIWATVLYTLGMLQPLATLASPAQDERGIAIALEQLPQRVRLAPKAPKAPPSARPVETPRKRGNRPSEPRR